MRGAGPLRFTLQQIRSCFLWFSRQCKARLCYHLPLPPSSFPLPSLPLPALEKDTVRQYQPRVTGAGCISGITQHWGDVFALQLSNYLPRSSLTAGKSALSRRWRSWKVLFTEKSRAGSWHLACRPVSPCGQCHEINTQDHTIFLIHPSASFHPCEETWEENCWVTENIQSLGP